MKNRIEFAIKFSENLSAVLKHKFGEIPSNKFFADEFNLRASGTSTITPETARKWIKGLTVPEIDRFRVLVLWLGIDMSDLFMPDGVKLSEKQKEEVVEAMESKIHDLLVTVRKFKN